MRTPFCILCLWTTLGGWASGGDVSPERLARKLVERSGMAGGVCCVLDWNDSAHPIGIVARVNKGPQMNRNDGGVATHHTTTITTLGARQASMLRRRAPCDVRDASAVSSTAVTNPVAIR